MNKKLIISLVMIGVLAFGAGLGTFAWFTSEGVVRPNEFKAGTLEIAVNGDKDGSYPIDFGEIPTNNMAPGDTTGNLELTIENAGSLDMVMFREFTMSGNEEFAKELLVSTFIVEDYSGTWDMVDLGFNEQWDADGNGIITLYDLANMKAEYGGGWDALALVPGGTQKLTIGFTFDEDATEQGRSCSLGMNIKATQVKAGAIEDLMDGTDMTWNRYTQSETYFSNEINKQYIPQ